MKIVFLDAISMGDTSLAEIAALGELTCYDSSTPEEARERVKDADVVLLNKVIVDEAFLDAAPRLRLICEAGTGMNNIDVKLCEKRGVIARNVAAYSTDSVAQTAWMHILNLLGRAFHYEEFVKSGAYSKNPVHVDFAHPFTEIAGKTLGIVGMGAIGQKVAAIGKAHRLRRIQEDEAQRYSRQHRPRRHCRRGRPCKGSGRGSHRRSRHRRIRKGAAPHEQPLHAS